MIVKCCFIVKIYDNVNENFNQNILFFTNKGVEHIIVDLLKLHEELRELSFLFCREKILSGNIEIFVSLAEHLLFGVMNFTAVAEFYFLLRFLQDSIVVAFVFIRLETSLAEFHLKLLLFECIISTSFAAVNSVFLVFILKIEGMHTEVLALLLLRKPMIFNNSI